MQEKTQRVPWMLLIMLLIGVFLMTTGINQYSKQEVLLGPGGEGGGQTCGAQAPPVLQPIGDKTASVGIELSFRLQNYPSFNDPNVPCQTVSCDDMIIISQLAGGSAPSFNAQTCLFSWTPTIDNIGAHQFKFGVRDSYSPPGTDEETITVTVQDINRPPILNQIGPKVADVSNLLEFTLSYSDPDNDNVFCLLPALPQGASFDTQTCKFSWIPQLGQEGVHFVNFVIEDSGSPPLQDSENVSISVGNANQPPVLEPIGDKEITEGNLLEFAIGFSDPDNDNLVCSSPDLPAGSTLTQTSGLSCEFSWLTAPSDRGIHDVTLVVTDDGSPQLQDSEQITITILEQQSSSSSSSGSGSSSSGGGGGSTSSSSSSSSSTSTGGGEEPQNPPAEEQGDPYPPKQVYGKELKKLGDKIKAINLPKGSIIYFTHSYASKDTGERIQSEHIIKVLDIRKQGKSASATLLVQSEPQEIKLVVNQDVLLGNRDKDSPYVIRIFMPTARESEIDLDISLEERGTKRAFLFIILGGVLTVLAMAGLIWYTYKKYVG